MPVLFFLKRSIDPLTVGFFLMIRMWYLLMMMVLVEMFDQKRFRSCSFTNIHQYHVPVITWFIFYFIKSIRPLLTKARSIYQNWPKLTKMGSNQNWIEWKGIKWTFWTNECIAFGLTPTFVGSSTFIRSHHPLFFKKSNKNFVQKCFSSGTKSLWNSNFGLAEWIGMNLNKLGNDYFKTCELGPLVRLTFSDL